MAKQVIEREKAIGEAFDRSNQLVWVEWAGENSLRLMNPVSWLSHFAQNKKLLMEQVFFSQDLNKAKSYFSKVPNHASQFSFRIKDRWSGFIPVKSVSFLDDGKIVMIWMINESQNLPTNTLAVAAHDLKSPINSILGLTGVMQMILKKENPDLAEVGKMIRMIRTSCNNALDFTSDLIELSDVEHNGKTIKMDQYYFNEFIEHFADTNRLITLRKNIKIKIESKLSHSEVFMCNQPKMFRALSNLLSNATKFSQSGDTVTIRLEKTDQHAIIRIIDRGVGMSQEILDNLFVKFGKSKRIGLQGEKSHGLGMSIVKQIVELHNGEIKVESREQEGTTISLLFNNK